MFGSKVTAILLSGSTLLIGGFAFRKGLLPAQQAVFFWPIEEKKLSG